MKKLHVIGLAIVAVFAFSAIAAASASAAPYEWLVHSEPVPSTAPVHVELVTMAGEPLLLWDMHAKVDLDCTGSGLGIVFEKFDVVEEATATHCEVLEGFCPSANATAANLPWLTELQGELKEPIGTVVDTLKADGKGAPGWNVVCAGIIEDTCTTEAGFTNNTNSEESGVADVKSEFPEAGAEATCSLGGKEGLVVGNLLAIALEGLPLSIS